MIEWTGTGRCLLAHAGVFDAHVEYIDLDLHGLGDPIPTPKDLHGRAKPIAYATSIVRHPRGALIPSKHGTVWVCDAQSEHVYIGQRGAASVDPAGALATVSARVGRAYFGTSSSLLAWSPSLPNEMAILPGIASRVVALSSCATSGRVVAATLGACMLIDPVVGDEPIGKVLAVDALKKHGTNDKMTIVHAAPLDDGRALVSFDSGELAAWDHRQRFLTEIDADACAERIAPCGSGQDAIFVNNNGAVRYVNTRAGILTSIPGAPGVDLSLDTSPGEEPFLVDRRAALHGKTVLHAWMPREHQFVASAAFDAFTSCARRGDAFAVELGAHALLWDIS